MYSMRFLPMYLRSSVCVEEWWIARTPQGMKTKTQHSADVDVFFKSQYYDFARIFFIYILHSSCCAVCTVLLIIYYYCSYFYSFEFDSNHRTPLYYMSDSQFNFSQRRVVVVAAVVVIILFSSSLFFALYIFHIRAGGHMDV